MDNSWDDIDAFYNGVFDEQITIGTVVGRGIVSRVDSSAPVELAGLRDAADLTVRCRLSDFPTRPAARTILIRESGLRYRIMAMALGSTSLEWILGCTQEIA